VAELRVAKFFGLVGLLARLDGLLGAETVRVRRCAPNVEDDEATGVAPMVVREDDTVHERAGVDVATGFSRYFSAETDALTTDSSMTGFLMEETRTEDLLRGTGGIGGLGGSSALSEPLAEDALPF